MATITLSDLTKHYNEGATIAVEDVNLEVEDGEFIVLVGPSGSGKSTILSMVAGLDTVTSGEVKINDEVVNEQKPRDRDIAMVFQNYALYPNMTVRENLEFGLKMSTDLSKDERQARIEQVAETVNITDLLDKLTTQLSGGEKQRTALGRAIVRDPAVFLMDEPLSNLDAKLRRTMRREIETLQSDLGVTTVYVTHNQTEAMTMGDRIMVLNNSEVQQIGTPLECYYKPNNLFVASFIGDPPMNFFDGQIDDGTFQSPAFTLDLDQAILDELSGHDDVTLGIRPEDIEVTDDSTADHAIACTVRVVEEMGATQHVHLETKAGDNELTVIADGAEIIQEDEEYFVTFPQEEIHVFDQATGEALHNCILRDARETKLTLTQSSKSLS